MNQESSRSHALFTIIVEHSTADEATGESSVTIGRLNLVDLAGSERIRHTVRQLVHPTASSSLSPSTHPNPSSQS